MLSSISSRNSLSVAPLAIHKTDAAAVSGDDAYLTALHNTTSLSSSSLLSAHGGNLYAHSQMTPPATPNGSQEDLSHNNNNNGYMHSSLSQPDPPPVFHNFLRAYYAFQPSYSPADSTVTLPMNEGDVILVHSIHTNGWADGTLLVSGARGWLPTNYCDAYEPDEMRNLLNALLNFWDLMRSTTVNDNEIFGNQEFMKGIIAGVRYLLERTECLTRESPLIQRHDGLRRNRKSLLSELSSLVKSAKRLQEYQRFPDPTENVNNIVDEMILKAFKIVVKAVRFCDVIEEDRQQYAQAIALSASQHLMQPITLMTPVQDEKSIPPTPPADSITFDGRRRGLSLSASDPLIASGAYAASSLTVSGAPVNKRLSSLTANYQHRLSQSGIKSSLVNNNRLSSSSMSHRVSLAGPSPLSQAHNLVSHRLGDRHDTFLSYLGSFIGRLHLHSQSRPQLALAIKQSATSGSQLLVVVDVVSGHDSLSREILHNSRVAMSDRILELVYLARDILTNQVTDVDDVIVPHDNGRLLTAATNCVKATGECVAKTKWVIERIGDFEYEFDDITLAFDVDLSVLDISFATVMSDAASLAATDTVSIKTLIAHTNETEQQTYPDVGYGDASDSFTPAMYDAQGPAAMETQLPSVSPIPYVDNMAARRLSSAVPHLNNLSVDKPLPEVPQVTSPIEDVSQSRQYSAASRPVSYAMEDVSAITSVTSSVSSTQPALPRLPRMSTYIPREGDSPVEQATTNEGEFTSSFHSESLTVNSSGTTSTYASRNSESSLVSRTSTRATTPDNTLVNQPSLSELSTTASSTLVEEAEEEVESKLLERTYAHELMFNKEGQVTGGSLPALVERLTTHESTPDAMFVSTFYLTFRLFCSPVKLAEALIDRFEYVGESPHMAAPVRLRVYNAFKGWLESHWRDELDREALVLIEPFAEVRLSSMLPSAGRRLLDLVERVGDTDATLVPRLVSTMAKTSTSIPQHNAVDSPFPTTLMSKALQNGLANWKMGGSIPSIMDFDPTEMARQLTMRQMNIFCSIMPDELLGSQWMKKGGLGAPNVKAMTALTTDLSNLVADTILTHAEVKRRAAVIKQWIKIAHQCAELQNYDALMAIICSLNSSTIARLRKTWDIVSQKRRDMLKTMQAIVEPAQNNKVLRGRLNGHVPPCLPFLGMYLTDLTFVDIGNPATKQLPGQDGGDRNGNSSDNENGSGGGGLTVVNFDKHMRTAKIIGELQRFQISYRLTEVPDIQEWIGEQISRVREMDKTQGDNVQVSYYRKSLLLEPREAQAQMLKSMVDAGSAAAVAGAFTIKEAGRADLFAWMRGGYNAANGASNV
ncbi:Ras guanine-nucleotide exchange protein cdc25p [Grosmannia clavigera kw1407]|uniref:Ras guanine-nucleotide exchange protein cdc25p n=1 Tax=Grosmannia clavigera (strain kw1407 / UAMH 11150) TaxID=655863 RepID=F0X753_GROCL|nr:Ras guanine-nucleotide exchange protein cdc25p [Grosmannia clavigera kw1407]EFX06303.1 Ras guanine-nucleotide exchange protein cdc25p [Grosmannia clavigera kw1407]